VSFDYPIALRFQCTKCGICCGDTNKKIRHILLLSNEAEQIAAATSRQTSEFAVKIENKSPYSYEMEKTTESGKCIFLENNRCSIYPLRPLVCRFYPFELRIAANRKHEFLHTDECPGIGKGKTLHKSYFGKMLRLAQAKARAECRPSAEKC